MVKYIDYKGKKILVTDYSQCKTIEDQIKLLKESEVILLKDNKKYLDLTIFTNAKGTKEFMKESKEFAKKTGHLMIKGALVIDHLSMAKKILLDAYNVLLGEGSKLKSFSNIDDAKEYLVK